jgi:nucleoside 2-deoxyribosyltransferase
MTSRPLIYIAGPFRASTPWEIEQNVRRAEEYGLWIAGLGGIPLCPHTMYRFYQNSLPDAFWLEAGIALLRKCDAVAVCVGELAAENSAGTTSEINDACARSVPVFYNTSNDMRRLANWIVGHKEHAK